MHLLTLVCRAAFSAEMLPRLQAMAAAALPGLPGLRARHWRPEGRALRGHYLFETRADLEALVRAPLASDPALALLVGPDPAGDTFEAARIEEVRADDVFDRPVFLISAPRAGSTLLYEVLSHSTELWTIDGESRGVLEGIPALHPASRGFATHRLIADDADPRSLEALRTGIIAELRDHRGRRYLEIPAPERPARVRFLEKTPENALRVPFLAAAFPEARFIFLHRDARQNVSSILEAWHHGGFVNIPDLPGWERRHWCFLLPQDWRSFQAAPLSDVAAFQWHTANQQALDELAALPPERWTSVEYDELLAAPAAVLRRLCRFLEIELDAPLAEVVSRPLPLSSTTISPPSPIKWRANRELLPSSLAGLGPLMGRLRTLTARPEAPPPRKRRGTPVYFSCFLHEQPAPTPAWTDQPSIVDPSFQLQLGPTVPLALVRRARFRERFLTDHPLAWVEDSATQMVYPFWARRGQARALAALQPGQELPPGLDPDLREQLQAAEILVQPGAPASRRGWGEALVERARGELQVDRFCKLPSLLRSSHVAALARYYRALIATGNWSLGDGQVERRHGWHNEALTRHFHWQLTDFVARVAGEPVKPTYCYSSAYRSGASLRAHLDRRQCEYTMSLLIDYAPPEADPWPLWFLAPAGKVSLTLDLGDAVLFRGCELPHWREAPRIEQEQTMLLFHYVPNDFAGVLD